MSKSTKSNAHQVHLVQLDEIQPYPGNPRNNEPAIDAVLASIKTFGFRIPVVLDKDDVIVSGHTRVEAMKKMREFEPDFFDEHYADGIPCFRAADLTEEQVRAFRLVDNKTSELATWNFDLLADEVALLNESGIQLVEFGWSAEEVDCLKSVVADDCLNPENWQPAAQPDGVDTAYLKPKALGEGADGLSVRAVIGTFGFMVLRTDYDAWFEGIMKEHNFDFDRATEEVARRLGLNEARIARDNFVRKQREELAAQSQKDKASTAELNSNENQIAEQVTV